MVLSAVAHEIRRQRPSEPITLAVAYPELYVGNLDVMTEPWSPSSPRTFAALDDMNTTGGEHQVTFMCRQLGLEPPTTIQQRAYFMVGEGGESPPFPRYVTVQSSAGPWAGNTKRWPAQDWRELVARLASDGRVKVVQVGSTDDPDVGADIDARGWPVRLSMRLLADARCHVGPISGPMHLANAVRTRSVIVAGGREQREVVGYVGDVWVEKRVACSPCWLTSCPVENGNKIAPCFSAISVFEVLEAVNMVLEGAA